MCLRGAACLTWIGGNLLYILQSPPSFLRFSRVFPLQSANVIARGGMSLLEPCGWWLVSPDAQQSVAPLPVAPWHKMRAQCAAGWLLLHTAAAAAETGERRSCTAETHWGEERRAQKGYNPPQHHRRTGGIMGGGKWRVRGTLVVLEFWLLWTVDLLHVPRK